MLCDKTKVAGRGPAQLVDEPMSLAQRDALRVVLMDDGVDARVTWRLARGNIRQCCGHDNVARALAAPESAALPGARDSNDVQLCRGELLSVSDPEEDSLVGGQAYEVVRAALGHEKNPRVVLRSPRSEGPIQ